jgi:hypothetical protein
MGKSLATKSVLLVVLVLFAPSHLCAKYVQTNDVSIEVFQVIELPLNVHEASLTKSKSGYLLKLKLGNSSELSMIGLRYTLAAIDNKNQAQPVVNRTEGLSIAAYATKTLTLKTPIKVKLKDGNRLVLMVEQVISRESIWEVVKAKEALEAYAKGDYSVVPVVLRVANQVDSPPAGRPPVIYRRN